MPKDYKVYGRTFTDQLLCPNKKNTSGKIRLYIIPRLIKKKNTIIRQSSKEARYPELKINK